MPKSGTATQNYFGEVVTDVIPRFAEEVVIELTYNLGEKTAQFEEIVGEVVGALSGVAHFGLHPNKRRIVLALPHSENLFVDGSAARDQIVTAIDRRTARIAQKARRKAGQQRKQPRREKNSTHRRPQLRR